ncbi:MAG: LysR family transcriptional regulator [Sphingomonadaceae bacterium]
MHWDDLRIFLAVARTGQIARAAPVLGIDPTTVGRHLRRLEKAMGQILFERHPGGQKLTEAGERLIGHAETFERLLQEIAPGGPDKPAGMVRVSTSEGFGTWFVAHHLGEFMQDHPAIQIDLVANSGFLSPSKRETDVAILLARPRKGPLITRRLTNYRLKIFAAKTYLAQHPPIYTPDALRDHTLIGYIPDFVYAPELHYLNEVAPGLEPRLRSSSINAQYRMTAAGAGIAILPCFIGDTDPLLQRVLPDFEIQRSFWLVTHQDTHNAPRIRQFTNWLTDLTIRRRDRLLGLVPDVNAVPAPAA